MGVKIADAQKGSDCSFGQRVMRFFEEIAEREDRNLYEIVLYPEGLFYKAYERSAFACVSRVSPFKPSKKHIKYCARDMVSVGFPAAVLSKYFPSAPRPLADGRVVIALTDRIDPGACEVWKASLPLKERQPRGSAGRMASVAVPLPEGRPRPLFAPLAAPSSETPVSVPCGSAVGGFGSRVDAPDSAVGSSGSPEAAHGPAAVPYGFAAAPFGPASRPAAAANSRAERVVRLIREFRLEAATPVECVLFVADLKKELDGYL